MQRLNCERYSCHCPEQDCSFCFCPFYPCMDARTKGQLEGDSWSCRQCSVIHYPEVAQTLMESLMSGDDLSLAWKKLERWL
jgi:threonine-phosphate decarboxylase